MTRDEHLKELGLWAEKVQRGEIFYLPYNLNLLLEFSRFNDLDLTVRYTHCTDEMELEVTSSAPAECYYRKKCTDFEDFIKEWLEHQVKKE